MGVAVSEPLSPASTADRLRQLWAEMLDEEDIAPDADFFDLGGNSFKAMDLMAKVRTEFGVELGIVALFAHSRLDTLAAELDRLAR